MGILIPILSSCQTQEVYEPFFKCSNKLRDQYGVCSHINRRGIMHEYSTREQDLTMIDRIGANYIRTDFDWIPIQTKHKGKLDYLYLDSMVASVNQHNASLLGILTIDKRKDVTDDWLNYIDQTCNRYKEVLYWEMLSEADLAYRWVPGFYSKQYIPFLKEGYRAVKRANKKAQVTFTGFSDIYSSKIDSIFSEGVENYFDIMSVHTYTIPQSGPEVFIRYFNKVSEIMNRYSIRKPVWLSETGGHTCVKGGVSEEVQSERLPRIFLISFALGVDKVFWYKTRSNELNANDSECHYGLYHKDYTPKPAYYAYQTFTKMCPNRSTRPKLVRKGDVYMASWKRPDRKKIWALWTSNNTKTVTVDISGNYKSYNHYGKELYLSDSGIEVSTSITYVVGAKSVNFTKEE